MYFDPLLSDFLPKLNYTFNGIVVTEGRSPMKPNSEFPMKMWLKILFMILMNQCSYES